MSRTSTHASAIGLTLGVLLSAVLVAPSSAGQQLQKPKITATPSATAVVVDAPATVSGTVPGPAKRRVLLERKVAGGWQVEDKAKTSANTYTLTVPTWWYANHKLRVRAPRKGPAKQATSKKFTVAVVPSYTPAGGASDYTLSNAKTRWNSCKVIKWKWRQGTGFAGSQAVFAQALAEITRATGLRFKYVGETSKVPLRDNVKKVADLVAGWATPDEVSELQGNLAGYGYAHWYSRRPSSGYEIYHGEIALDVTEPLEQSYSPSGLNTSWGMLMLHEIGHAVGLLHASNPDQVMFPSVGQQHLGNGDLKGLRIQGASKGCWDRGAR